MVNSELSISFRAFCTQELEQPGKPLQKYHCYRPFDPLLDVKIPFYLKNALLFSLQELRHSFSSSQHTKKLKWYADHTFALCMSMKADKYYTTLAYDSERAKVEVNFSQEENTLIP